MGNIFHKSKLMRRKTTGKRLDPDVRLDVTAPAGILCGVPPAPPCLG